MENTNDVNKEVTVVKRGRGRPKIHTDCPSTLVCKITGKTVKTNPTQFRKQVDRSGVTRQEFIDNYVSREGKRMLKDMKTEAKLKTHQIEATWDISNLDSVKAENSENLE